VGSNRHQNKNETNFALHHGGSEKRPRDPQISGKQIAREAFTCGKQERADNVFVVGCMVVGITISILQQIETPATHSYPDPPTTAATLDFLALSGTSEAHSPTKPGSGATATSFAEILFDLLIEVKLELRNLKLEMTGFDNILCIKTLRCPFKGVRCSLELLLLVSHILAFVDE
jgi:hypothetical protein